MAVNLSRDIGSDSRQLGNLPVTLVVLVTVLSAVRRLPLPLRSLLFGVSRWDVGTFFSVTCLLLASALFSSYIPARRAASIDPTEALRSE